MKPKHLKLQMCLRYQISLFHLLFPSLILKCLTKPKLLLRSLLLMKLLRQQVSLSMIPTAMKPLMIHLFLLQTIRSEIPMLIPTL